MKKLLIVAALIGGTALLFGKQIRAAITSGTTPGGTTPGNGNGFDIIPGEGKLGPGVIIRKMTRDEAINILRNSRNVMFRGATSSTPGDYLISWATAAEQNHETFVYMNQTWLTFSGQKA